jgi:outer membrane biosynthesis protein TonB
MAEDALEPVEGDEASLDSTTDIDWSGLSEDFDGTNDADDDSESIVLDEAAEAPEPPPENTVPQETPPPAEETVAEAEPLIEEVVQEAPPEPEPVPEPEVIAEPVPEPQIVPEPEQSQLTDEQQAKLRENYIDSLSPQYKLTDDEVNSFITDPNSVLPKLAATLQATVLEQATQMALQVVQQALPNYLDGYMQTRQQTQAGEDAFFSQWEELKPHRERVMSIAKLYRELNPGVAKEQFIRDVGMQAWMTVGLDAAALASKLDPQPAPVVEAPPPPPQQQGGYNPASPGAAPTPPPRAPSNPFSALAEEWADDF